MGNGSGFIESIFNRGFQPGDLTKFPAADSSEPVIQDTSLVTVADVKSLFTQLNLNSAQNLANVINQQAQNSNLTPKQILVAQFEEEMFS